MSRSRKVAFCPQNWLRQIQEEFSSTLASVVNMSPINLQLFERSEMCKWRLQVKKRCVCFEDPLKLMRKTDHQQHFCKNSWLIYRWNSKRTRKRKPSVTYEVKYSSSRRLTKRSDKITLVRPLSFIGRRIHVTSHFVHEMDWTSLEIEKFACSTKTA